MNKGNYIPFFHELFQAENPPASCTPKPQQTGDAILSVLRLPAGIFYFLSLKTEATGAGIDMGFPAPARFALMWDDIVNGLQKLSSDLEKLQQDAAAKRAAETEEWLTVGEFARNLGLSDKTISNYCGKGRFSRTKKDSNGQWLIHKSELEKY